MAVIRMKWRNRSFSALAVSLVTIFSAFANEDPEITFFISEKMVARYTLSKLKKELKSKTITYFDPFFEKQKCYEAFPLRTLFELAFGPSWRNSDYSDVIFEALDGFESPAKVSKMEEDGGYVAFRDPDVPAWELIGHKKMNPGPFYLFWTGKDQTAANEYPWTWQLASIKLVKFEEQYPKVVPKGAKEDSSTWRGYEIFKGQCVRCHAMDQQGGKIGPDLNAPQGIVAYRPKKMIKAFIKEPSKFRYTHMPDHPHFSERDLDDLVAYFEFQSKRSKE